MQAPHGTGPSADPAAPRSRLSVVAASEPGLGSDALALPGEDALLVRIALPLASHRQRQAAAGFAIEDLIAEPLDATHVVLGPELAPGEYLVIAVRHSVMRAWAGQPGGVGRRLVPDVLALPVPAAGSCSVREVHGRVLVRRADGTGHACHATGFEPLWRADGSPQIVLYGGRLPEGLPVSATGLMPVVATPEALAIDLLQGTYAAEKDGRRRLFVRLAAVLVAALAAHGGILALDAAALQRIATTREAALRTEIAARVPALPAALPIDVALRRAMPAAASAGGGFLPLMATVAAALQPVASDVSMRSVAFDGTDGSLAMSVEAADLATLQRVETGLGAAGLAVTSGVATTGNGGAEVRFVVRGAGG